MSVWYKFKRYKQKYLLEVYEKQSYKKKLICLSHEISCDGKRVYFIAFEDNFISLHPIHLSDPYYYEVSFTHFVNFYDIEHLHLICTFM